MIRCKTIFIYCFCDISPSQSSLEFPELLIKVINLYESKARFTLKCDGSSYKVGDFIIRIGELGVTNKSAVASIMEVEYLPCNNLESCDELVTELAMMILSGTASKDIKQYKVM